MYNTKVFRYIHFNEKSYKVLLKKNKIVITDR